MMAIIADIMASVEPQQIVISRSGSYRSDCVRSNLSTTASRNGLAPQVIAYWLMSSEIAWRAASFISAGAAKSGKPCERLTALCFIARRVISRITDSVNCSALAEIIRRDTSAIFISGVLIFPTYPSAANLTALRSRHGGGLRTGSINHPVQRGVAQHDLHVV